MASNKHHEFTKLAMNQLADSLPDFTLRQANKFVNIQGEFPLIIKLDYVGKWRLKGETRLYVVAGVEIAADYMYFNPARTWVNAKRKFYITNFMCGRDCLLSHKTEWYVLEKGADGKVDVETIKHELIHHFLPYLNQLTSLDAMISVLRHNKPSRNELLNPSLYGPKPIYDWLTVIYLLFKAREVTKARQCIDEFISLIHDNNLPDYELQNVVIILNRLQSDFETSKIYRYSESTHTIMVVG